MSEQGTDQAGVQQAEMPKGRVIFTYDPATGNISWGKEGAPIPHALIINAMELAKMMFLSEQMAHFVQQKPGIQRGVFVPEGSPFRS